jgi:hypothetical protein
MSKQWVSCIVSPSSVGSTTEKGNEDTKHRWTYADRLEYPLSFLWEVGRDRIGFENNLSA